MNCITFRRFSRRVSLSLRADVVQLSLLRLEGKSYVIEQSVCLPLPAGAIQEDRIEQGERVRQVVTTLVQQMAVQGCKAFVVFPSGAILKQRVQWPVALREQECEMELSAHLMRYFPGVTQELVFDFFEKDQIVHVVAASALLVNAYAEVARLSGLKVIRVSPEEFNYLNLLPWRTNARAIKKRIIKILITILVIIGIVFIRFYSSPTTSPGLPEEPKKYVPTFRWVGYLHQGKRLWALIAFSNNRVEEVHQGSFIETDQVYVTHLDEKEMRLEKNQQSYLLHYEK